MNKHNLANAHTCAVYSADFSVDGRICSMTNKFIKICNVVLP
jgi:hypothetical protein